MIIHLVYPVNLKKISAPWSLGNNLYNFLINKGLKVKIYQWTSYEKIKPNHGDILIGHAHPNPLTCMRRSINDKKWLKKILLQPYNEDPHQMSYLNNIINNCDFFISITGEYWFNRIENTIFSTWKKKMIRIDMGINQNDFPQIKTNFNQPGKRKFLYIGNDYKFNNFAKNLPYLNKIIASYGHNYFGIAGNKKVNLAKFHGWLDFKTNMAKDIIKNYDFYLIVSKNDANPTTILESMAWGLIPICTKECGYYNNNGIINLPLDNLDEALKVLEQHQYISKFELEKKQKYNFEQLKSRFNWEIICQKIYETIFLCQNFSKIEQSEKERKIFKDFEKDSNNYYNSFANQFKFLLTSIKFFLKKFFNI